jgi:hypothetical protein
MTPRVDAKLGSTEPLRDEPAERRYRIGLCAALSDGMTGERARSAAQKIQRLRLTPSDDAQGIVLDRAAAFRAAAWRQYTSAFTLAVYVLGFGFLPVLYVFEEWADFKTLLMLLAAVVVIDLLRLAKWWRNAPALLSSLPPAGTAVSAGPRLVIGTIAVAYDEIRIEKIVLVSVPDLLFPNIWSDYFIDKVDITAAGRTYRLDAAAISNGQVILDTLCASVPLHAFSGGDLAGPAS